MDATGRSGQDAHSSSDAPRGTYDKGGALPMEPGESRIALLIDADNAPASKIDVILAEVARHGAANVRRAYGDWKSPHLKSWEAVLHAYAIRPIQQFAYSSG